jgi:RNA polymerase sigma factor (sigma-70 family)
LEQAITIQASMVKKARQGDADAKSWLYHQHSKVMFNICVRMTGNTNDAEDILQDVFIKAFTRLGQLKQPEFFGPWLRRIVVTECLKHGKRSVNWKELDDEYPENDIDEASEWWYGISMEYVNREIKNLPGGCRQVFVLYALEDYTHKAISQSLGISESTSKSQYQRARQLLKERITKQIAVNG